jgi:chromosome segregation ATPase
LAAIGDPERLTYHMGWAFTARYTQHVSSMLQEVTTIGTYQRLRLEEFDNQMEAKNRLINRVLL